jgi:hypothetical protein
MANTVSLLSYANTFGDWVVTTNNLLRENNDLASNNYIKPTGTLYLNSPTLGLQVANNATIAGQLSVQGVGSSAYVQNNFRVDGASTLAGSNIISANVTGTGTALNVSNNATIGGTLTLSGLTVSVTSGQLNASITGNALTANNAVNATTVTNGVYTSGSYANPSWITSLANTKISGLITSGQIASIANTQITGLITASQIAGGTVVNSITGTTNQVTANVSTGNVLLALPQNIHTAANVRFNSLGVGVNANNNTGEILAANNITSYYSDDRLKDRMDNIPSALSKVLSLNGFYYKANDIAQSLGYSDKIEVGLSAQEVQKVLPEVIAAAPIDSQYMTIHYERVIPLLVEAIKELSAEVEKLKK